MDVKLSRRQFFKICATGIGGSSLATLGFSPGVALAEVREFKLLRTTETRNTCPYCSVGCGIIMYSLGDKAKNARAELIHIEGDADHPVNRGTLCPKGAGLLAVYSVGLGIPFLAAAFAIEPAMAAIARFRAASSVSDRRRLRDEYQLRERLAARAIEYVERDVLAPGELDTIVDRIAARELDPYSAADDLLIRAGLKLGGDSRHDVK